MGADDELAQVRAVLARNLQGALDAKKFSHRNAATRSGVARQTIENILNKKANPTLDRLVRLATCLGLKVGDLLSEST